MNWWEDVNVGARTTGLTAVSATTILGIATFLHLDKFHLNSPALLTQFVTWVWIIVYIVTPFVFLWRWLAYGRKSDASMGAKPFPAWIRIGYLIQGFLTLLAGLALFFAPQLMISYWAWELTPLTSRAVSAWVIAYGLACLEVNRENNTINAMPARISLLIFSVLQLIAIARYFSSFDLSKPIAWIYLLVMIIGVVINLPKLYARN